jgi:hypothetical protein
LTTTTTTTYYSAMTEMSRDFLTDPEKNAIDFVQNIQSILEDLIAKGCKVSAETLAMARHDELEEEEGMRRSDLDNDTTLDDYNKIANEEDARRALEGFDLVTIIVTSSTNLTSELNELRPRLKRIASEFQGKELDWHCKFEISRAAKYVATIYHKTAKPETALVVSYKFK